MTEAQKASVSIYVDTCHALADVAAMEILPHFRQPMEIQNKASKASFDPVTIADRNAEAAIRKRLSEMWPNHGVIGEEYTNTLEDASCQWIVDPIDGTRSFIMGLPTWGTLIGLMEAGTPLVGMMVQPFTGERFWSDSEASYWRKGEGNDARTMTTRSCSSLQNAILSTTHPDLFQTVDEQSVYSKIAKRVRMSRFGGDCYQYVMLAAGYVDAVIESGLSPYDIVPLIPIVERAGGRVSTWSGGRATAGGQIVATGDPALHDELLELLRSAAS